MNGSPILLFLDQQVGDEETAQYKKEIYTQVTMLKESLNIIEGIGAFVPDVVEEGQVTVVQEYQEKRYEPEAI